MRNVFAMYPPSNPEEFYLESPEEFFSKIDEKTRRKLALGKYYDILNLNSEQLKQVKVDIINAKKYEKDLLGNIQKVIENEELKKIEGKLDTSKDPEKLRQYYEEVERVAELSESILKRELQRAEHFETELLSKTQEQIMRSEAQKLLQNRIKFKKNEEEIRAKEQKEFEERQNPKIFSSKFFS